MSVAAVIASGTTSIAGRTVLNLVNCFSVDRKLTAAFFVSPAVKADSIIVDFSLAPRYIVTVVHKR